MRVVFLGSGAFGVPTLRALAEQHEVAHVITQPDKPAGRGGSLTPTPVSAVAEELSLRVSKPERVNAPEALTQIRGVAADAWVVIAYGQKLGAPLLDGVFAINLHASLLPRWRGAAPIHHAVMAGDTELGNSVITLADRMDAGDVLATTRRPIEPTDTTGDLHDLLAEDGVSAVLRVLEAHREGRVDRTEQDHSRVTFAHKLSRTDATIDFSHSAATVRCHINGLSPWPGCSVETRGTTLKLLRAGPAEGTGPAGTLLDVERGIVACGGGTIRLIDVQPAGKRPMPYADFARGHSLSSGDSLNPANRS
ncbi:MAG: methionyl-tRNA formyltransferase [Planctomycetota bacterium]